AAVAVLAVAGFYALGLHRYFDWDYVRDHLDIWQAQVRQHLLLALLFFFLVYLAAATLSLPVAAVLTLLPGALVGRWLGLVIGSESANPSVTTRRRDRFAAAGVIAQFVNAGDRFAAAGVIAQFVNAHGRS